MSFGHVLNACVAGAFDFAVLTMSGARRRLKAAPFSAHTFWDFFFKTRKAPAKGFCGLPNKIPLSSKRWKEKYPGIRIRELPSKTGLKP
jgi:hypothetical protein